MATTEVPKELTQKGKRYARSVYHQAAAYYLAVGIINVLWKISEKINDNEND